MKRRHLAIFTLQGNGHVYPLLPMISELVKRGYRITFPTCDYYARQLGSIGAVPVVYKNTAADPQVEQWWASALSVLRSDDPRWFQVPDVFYDYLLKSTTDVISQIETFYDNHRPDLILYDRASLPSRIMAQRLSVPTAQVAPHFAYLGKTLFWDNGTGRNLEGMQEYADRIDNFYASQGVTKNDNIWKIEDLNVHLIPREFQYRPELFENDGRFRFVGRHLTRPLQSQWIDRSNGKPIIVLSGLSGIVDIPLRPDSSLKLVMEALSGLRCHCILALGDNSVSTNSLGRIPENFEVDRSKSLLEILLHAALLVCHGGMGTTLEAIYTGVPVLMIPSHPGTHEVASRAVELGLGISLPRQSLTVQQIRDTAQHMLMDTVLMTRVTAMQQVFTASGGPDVAADAIQSSVESI